MCLLLSKSAKEAALSYVEGEVLHLKDGFEAKELLQQRAVDELKAELAKSRTEVTALSAALDAKERAGTEQSAMARQSEERVQAVEAEMRRLLQDMAKRQQLAHQLLLAYDLP